MGGGSTPEFTGLELTGLTASKLVATDADKLLTSDVESLHPTFVGITIKNSSGDIIFYVDDDEMYFTGGAIAIADGMCIGLLLSLTYKT